MSIYYVKDSDITNIADAIRIKRDETDEYLITEMPNKILTIEGSSDGVPMTFNILNRDCLVITRGVDYDIQ